MRILLVEDDKFFRRFYAMKLREKNLTVDEAGDGEEGLQRVKENIPDIVLLDLIMPNKDGFEFLQALGQMNLLSKIPVLVFSTLAQEKDIEKAKQLGARGYVNKSFFDFERLFATIMQMIQAPSATTSTPTSAPEQLQPVIELNPAPQPQPAQPQVEQPVQQPNATPPPQASVGSAVSEIPIVPVPGTLPVVETPAAPATPPVNEAPVTQVPNTSSTNDQEKPQ